MGDSDPPDDEPASLFTPVVVRGLVVSVLGCMFAGMALWTLVLDPNPTPAPWAGWRVRDALLTLAAAYCLRGTAQCVWAVLMFQRELHGRPPVPQLTNNLGLGAWQLLGCVVAIGAFALAPYGVSADALGLVPAARGYLMAGAVIGFVAGPGGVLLFVLIGKLTRDPMKLEGVQADFLDPRSGPRPPRLAVIGMMLVGIVLAPLAEELLFRGVVYPGLRSALGPWPAVPLSAVLFGLAHRDHGKVAVVFAAIVGVAFALLVEGSGSLWPAVLAHLLVNTKLVVMYLGPFRDPTTPVG